MVSSGIKDYSIYVMLRLYIEKSVCRQRISGHKLYACEISSKPQQITTCSQLGEKNCLKSPAKHNRNISNTIKCLRLIYEDKTIKRARADPY